MTTAEVLRAAKAYLIERGWVQGDDKALGDLGRGTKGCCVATAIVPFLGPAFRLDRGMPIDVFKTANSIPDSLGNWNDAPERTLDEVLTAFDKAITAADLLVTHKELKAMTPARAVLAFLRACRTYKPVGDIDGPWADEGSRLLLAAAGISAGPGAWGAWERQHTRDEVFAVMDEAIAAAEENARGHQE